VQKLRYKSCAPRRRTANAQRFTGCQARRHVSRKQRDITRIFAFRYSRHQQCGWPLKRQVFKGVHREVNVTAHERVIQLGRKKFLAVDLGEWLVEYQIATGIYTDQFDLQSRVQRFERARHKPALRACQRRAPRSEAQKK
jgi:hypothetical protein